MADAAHYDMIVIGAGPAGVNAAVTAAMLGKSVVVVEKNQAVGGAGANTGTLPSKTLRETALALSGLKSRQLYGVDLSLRREASVAELMFHERTVKHAAQAEIIGLFERCNVPLVHGAAGFVDAHTVRVDPPGGGDPDVLTADTIVIAIGSAPSQPPLFPFAHHRVWDSDEVLEITFMPKTMIVVGAGVIGSEYACTFAALGVAVQIVDGRDALLPFLDLEVAQTLEHAMIDIGISFRWKQNVVACEPTDDDVKLTLDTGEVLTVDAVLVAAGRSSRTDKLNPDAAGLQLGKRGLIPVDEFFRTNVKNIYAVGDVVGFPALASTSAEQGRIAASHACGSDLLKGMPPMLPTGIYAIPEVGMVGETEGTLQAHGIEYVAGKAMYAENSRGKIIGDTTGFLKLLFRKDDMALVGVHAIGEQATELVHIGMMAMRAGGGTGLFLNTCFNYPTLGNLYKTATFKALINRHGRLDKLPANASAPHDRPPTEGDCARSPAGHDQRTAMIRTAVALLIAALAGPAAVAADRPHVLVIVADDLRWDCVRAWGTTGRSEPRTSIGWSRPGPRSRTRRAGTPCACRAGPRSSAVERRSITASPCRRSSPPTGRRPGPKRWPRAGTGRCTPASGTRPAARRHGGTPRSPACTAVAAAGR